MGGACPVSSFIIHKRKMWQVNHEQGVSARRLTVTAHVYRDSSARTADSKWNTWRIWPRPVQDVQWVADVVPATAECKGGAGYRR